MRHDENRYGHVSSKLFIGAEYVMKHINSKQAAAVDARREKILDAVYLDNYLAAARETRTSRRSAEKAKEKTQRGADRRAKNKGRAGKDRAIAEAIVQAKEGGRRRARDGPAASRPRASWDPRSRRAEDGSRRARLRRHLMSRPRRVESGRV